MAEFRLRDFGAIAYDFDGTIADSVAGHELARQRAFEAMVTAGDERFAQVDPLIFAEAHRHGSHPASIIGWVLRKSGIVSAEESALDPLTLQVVDLKKAAHQEIARQGGVPVDGALDFIRRASVTLPGREHIVTTAGRQTEVLPFLIRHGLTRYFPDNRIVAVEEVNEIDPKALKPNPLAYTIMLERAGFIDKPECVLGIEDSVHGVLAGKRAGLTMVALETTHAATDFHDLAPAYRPDFTVPGFAELGELLR